ncbi:Tricarboxylate transport protein TctB [Halomonas citrativorans]|uniref:Tricarboxylate transport protein TctB n=1 Tax=Halomonas citrativorans TaxID=2742612 RepID=A0A1R4HZ31_9GAMM|nr:tripartite tricarboxylate transporter TctB family protein [Halomonas citrativorans]MBE0402475.1 tripartite tricarboxylate transporter TctB family protein [Halomonas citrativorans]SJN12594.1 Tricarboxylate transport protein TctB [Halomonas citrativorans]
MLNRDIVDIITGMALAAFGLIIAAYATTHYNLGSLQRMGPGMVPMGIGSIIALLGIMLSIGGASRPHFPMPSIEWRPLAAILSGILVFSLAVPRVGLVPAIFLLTLITSLADKQLRIKTVLALIAFLILVAILIFRLALGMNIPIFRWAF